MHCFLIFFCLAIVIIIPLESLLFAVFKPTEFDAGKIFKIPTLVLELFRLFGFFVMIGIFNDLFTEMGKFTIGRLRPHFLTLCNLDLKEIECKDDQGFQKFVIISNDSCSMSNNKNWAPEVYEKYLIDGRKSFLSGHTSYSFYVAVFLVLYLHCKLTHFQIPATNRWTHWLLKGIQIFKPYMQFGLLALATFVGMSRISDYMHHPGDVITGALVGTIFGKYTITICM